MGLREKGQGSKEKQQRQGCSFQLPSPFATPLWLGAAPILQPWEGGRGGWREKSGTGKGKASSSLAMPYSLLLSPREAIGTGKTLSLHRLSPVILQAGFDTQAVCDQCLLYAAIRRYNSNVWIYAWVKLASSGIDNSIAMTSQSSAQTIKLTQEPVSWAQAELQIANLLWMQVLFSLKLEKHPPHFPHCNLATRFQFSPRGFPLFRLNKIFAMSGLSSWRPCTLVNLI